VSNGTAVDARGIATVQNGNDTAKQTFRLNADNIEVRP
jgi:hypothetical protein